MNMWAKLSGFVESGREGPKVDLKRELTLENKVERARFAKDVLAMANTIGGQGYIVVGVLDAKDRATPADAHDYIVGYSPPDSDAFQRLIQQSLDTYCDPVPEVRYETVLHPGTERTLGVVVIPRSYNAPHKARTSGEGLTAGSVYVRRGSATFQATPEEVTKIEAKRGATCILVNFGRSINEMQRQQVESLLGVPIYEIIAVSSALDDAQPYGPQMQARLEETGLTFDEWDSLNILLNAHPFAPATATLLGILHGLHGCFPDVIRMRGIPEKPGEFEVAEILCPQELRNQARSQAGA